MDIDMDSDIHMYVCWNGFPDLASPSLNDDQ